MIALHVHAGYEYEYIDGVYPLSLDNYESENIFRRLLMGEDGGDEYDKDDNDEDDDDYDNNYQEERISNKNDFNSVKRDLIKGPSYLPSIDDDIADNDIEQENNDVQMGYKRKTIERTGKAAFHIKQKGKKNPWDFPFKKDKILSRKEKRRGKTFTV